MMSTAATFIDDNWEHGCVGTPYVGLVTHVSQAGSRHPQATRVLCKCACASYTGVLILPTVGLILKCQRDRVLNKNLSGQKDGAAWAIARLSVYHTLFHTRQQPRNENHTSASTKLNIIQFHASKRTKRANHCGERRAASQHALSDSGKRIPKSHSPQRPDHGQSRGSALKPDR